MGESARQEARVLSRSGLPLGRQAAMEMGVALSIKCGQTQ